MGRAPESGRPRAPSGGPPRKLVPASLWALSMCHRPGQWSSQVGCLSPGSDSARKSPQDWLVGSSEEYRVHRRSEIS
eukprot:8527153-Alexandrium_andersonii.AAC.1